jgi:hypothetical protein
VSPARMAATREGARPLAVKRLVAVGDDGWWVERDNAREGVDSWQVGAVPGRGRVAVVLARVWPRPRAFPGGGHAGRGHRG